MNFYFLGLPEEFKGRRKKEIINNNANSNKKEGEEAVSAFVAKKRLVLEGMFFPSTSFRLDYFCEFGYVIPGGKCIEVSRLSKQSIDELNRKHVIYCGTQRIGWVIAVVLYFSI